MKIVFQNLTKVFQSHNKSVKTQIVAVNDFTFEIPDGELIGLLGPSGCGKSTTLNLICGLQAPTSGRIFFGDDDVTDLPPEKRGVGLVFQNYALYPHLTVQQNILFPLQNLKGADKLSKADMLERAGEVAGLVQIDELMDRKPSELSGGQQQRVGIARAMAVKPDVILFDEPTSALDPELIGETLEAIKKIAQNGTAMIIVTHEMSFAFEVANHAIFMDGGVIVEENTPKELFYNPLEIRTKQFLSRISRDKAL